jgi:2-polyprenyl-3-methyl-5-hydroxy-6-metoxy-1,4-benzoquinol methylase
VGKADWNHNIQYYDLVLGSIPLRCRRALDVGCGTGLLARRLAVCCDDVVAIDSDRDVIALARASNTSDARVTFVEGDIMNYQFNDSFDLITAVAALHHIPLSPGLTRLRSLLNTDGVLVVVGLYRSHTFLDYAWAAAGFITSWILGSVRGHADVAAPLQNPRETLAEIRSACDRVLPGYILRRHVLFRYSVTWRKS